jgi:hypothetical protein
MLADCVEKVRFRDDILRTASASRSPRGEGPYQMHQNRPRTLVSILQTLGRLELPTCINCEIFEAPRISSFSTQSAQSRHGATSDLSPLCTKERKPLVRIGAAKALAQFGGVTPAVGKTPRQTAPSPQRSSVVAHFSDTRAMLPLASRARPTARPVRATYRFAGDQTLLSGDISVASCGNFPNHHSWHAHSPLFAG